MKTALGSALILGVTLAQCTEDPYAAIARAHAPMHFQDTDSSSPTSDMLTAIDYDGNWIGTDNWDNLFTPSNWGPAATGTTGVVYRSVVESCTHYFIVYAMFHPRDWTDHSFDQEHENDMEGLLVVVTKDGTPNGRVDGVITVAHLDFYSFTPAGSPWTNGDEDIDGTLSFAALADGPHLKTSQEAKGHGLKAWPFAGDFAGNPGEDGITYIPADVGAAPANGDSRDVPYQLVNLFDSVWFLQLTNSAPFATWGKLAGDESGSCGDGVTITCAENAANMPWSWDDGDDGDQVLAGALALDPATAVDVYFNGLGNFSHHYISNQYLTDLRNNGYSNAFRPSGMDSRIDLDAMYTHLDGVCP